MKSFSSTFLMINFLFVGFCFNNLSFTACKECINKVWRRLPSPNKPITIFVHGGGRPMSYIFAFPGFHTDCPHGIWAAKDLCKCSCNLGHKVSDILSESDPQMFPFDSFYIFGWSSMLSFSVRKKYGRALYHVIKQLRDNPKYKNTPINIVTHSHGGNVALNVAAAAYDHNDDRPLIDNLVLMGCPVVVDTDEWISAPTFKKVFALYSQSDFTQVIDLQCIYQRKYRACLHCPFFSQRIFKNAPGVIQAEIKFNNRSSTGHLGFVSEYFLNKLPDIIRYLSNENKLLHLPKDENLCYCLSINTKNWCLEPCKKRYCYR